MRRQLLAFSLAQLPAVFRIFPSSNYLVTRHRISPLHGLICYYLDSKSHLHSCARRGYAGRTRELSDGAVCGAVARQGRVCAVRRKFPRQTTDDYAQIFIRHLDQSRRMRRQLIPLSLAQLAAVFRIFPSSNYLVTRHGIPPFFLICTSSL
jgi:hypothetical protein